LRYCGRIVFADHPYVPGLKIAAIGMVVEVPVVVIVLTRVLVPVFVILVPVFGPGRPAQEQAGKE